jgi:hypothetical protein
MKKTKKKNQKSTSRKKKTENNKKIVKVEQMEVAVMEQECSIIELLPGTTIEEMHSSYFDLDVLIEKPYKVWQINSNGHRYYYRYDERGNPVFYPSVTTILTQTMPKSKYLIEWIAEKGIEESERYKMERAAYGTFMHGQFEELLIKKQYNLDSLKERLKFYIELQRLPSDFIIHADELKKDLLSFAQFVIDFDVRPIAIEITLVHKHYKYAGMVDLVCSMLDKPGGTNRINVIVDFKSGRKGFYEESEIQLHMYKELWNDNYDLLPVHKVFNFSPKNWIRKPTYNFKDQTNSINAGKIKPILEIAAIEDSKRENVFTSVSGFISIERKSDLSKNVTSLTLSELIKIKTDNKSEEVVEKVIEPAVEEEIKEEPVEEVRKIIEIKKRNSSSLKTKVVKEKKSEPEVISAVKEKQEKLQERNSKIDLLNKDI